MKPDGSTLAQGASATEAQIFTYGADCKFKVLSDLIFSSRKCLDIKVASKK